MSEHIYNLYEAKTSLSSLVERASRGEEIIIAKAGKGLAKLVPLGKGKARRKPGRTGKKIFIADDFDAPLPRDMVDAWRT